jgi:hypothetical protein
MRAIDQNLPIKMTVLITKGEILDEGDRSKFAHQNESFEGHLREFNESFEGHV